MLSCHPAQHPQFLDFENHFGHLEALPSSSIFTDLPTLGNITSYGRTALSQIDNCCSPHSHVQYQTGAQKSMQPSYPHQPHGYSQSEETTNIYGSKDSGLGITTDANYFVPYSRPPQSGTPQMIAFNHIDYNENGQPPLGSPFDEVPRVDPRMYNVSYPNHTNGGSISPVFAQTHEQTMYQQAPRSSMSQAPISPGMGTPYQMSSYISQNQFKRPSVGVGHNSSSRLSQQSFPPAQTPSSEYSGYQQTPSSGTTEWQEQHDFSHTGARLPEEVLENARRVNYEQIPYDQPSMPSLTMPAPRRKQHMRPSFSGAEQTSRGTSPARLRAASMGHFLQMPPYDQYMNNSTSVQQLPLPPLPSSMIASTPQVPVQQRVLPGTPASQIRQHSRSNSSTPLRRKRPSSPPASDFVNQNMPYLVPMKQDPTFPGDLYTPRYKRRTPNGRWEGWCGYCTPGRWLDLKNSRYWEDKLRNHGICAKTKMRFDEPTQIRWVSSDGAVIPEDGSTTDGGDPFLDQRKREGLCGRCHNWIGMDGLRTKARDRAVGWWMHAYKCHDHDKTVERTAAG